MKVLSQITPKFLEEVFCHPDFLSSIKGCASLVRTQECEVAFDVASTLDLSQTFIARPRIGSPNSMSGSIDDNEWFDKVLWHQTRSSGCFVWLGVHFHPGDVVFFRPSEHDLFALKGRKTAFCCDARNRTLADYGIKPIEGVASLHPERGGVVLLLMQEEKNKVSDARQIITGIERRIAFYLSFKDIDGLWAIPEKVLRTYGYKAETLFFSEEGIPAAQDIEKLATFAYAIQEPERAEGINFDELPEPSPEEVNKLLQKLGLK